MTIWKYSLKADDVQEVEIPIGSKLLSVQTQNGIPCLWVLVYEKNTKEVRKVYTFGTGEPLNFLPEALTFIGTYQMYNGELVFHVFID